MSCDDHPVLKSVLTYTTGLTYAVYPLLTRVYDCGKPVSIYQFESKYVYPLFERVYYCGKPVLIFEPVSTHGGTAKTSHSISSTNTINFIVPVKRQNLVDLKNKKKWKNNIKRHTHTVHGDVRYPCNQCDFKTTWKGYLKKHISSKHEGVRYSCDLCNYKAKWKCNLKTHIDSVHGDMQYSCDQCDYETKSNGLKPHVHGGVRYSFDLCDFKTIWKCNLQGNTESTSQKTYRRCSWRCTV